MDTDLSPERRLVGNNNQGLATYRQLIQNMSSKTKPDGGALQLILEKLGGGGHITVAGAQIEGMTLEEAKQELIIRINEYFSEVM